MSMNNSAQHMKHLLIALLLLSCYSCAFNCTKGEGEVITKEIDLDVISGIDISSSADVNLKFDLNQKVEIRGQENMIALLNTSVDDGLWTIDFSENVCFDKDFIIDITLPKIEKIEINGSGNVKSLTPFHAEQFDLDIRGSGDVELDINSEELNTSIKGSGDIELQGYANEHNIDVHGSGSIDAKDLKVKVCDVDIAGSGSCKITVTEELEVSIKGSGDVIYYGNPEETKISVNGSGEAIKK